MGLRSRRAHAAPDACCDRSSAHCDPSADETNAGADPGPDGEDEDTGTDTGTDPGTDDEEEDTGTADFDASTDSWEEDTGIDRDTGTRMDGNTGTVVECDAIAYSGKRDEFECAWERPVRI